MKERVFVALGANLGDRRDQLARGLVSLDASPGVSLVGCSSWYASAAVGGPADQPDYLNGACELWTELEPRELLDRLLEIERQVGRDRSIEPRFGARVLDLDLLLYGDRVVDKPGLQVPHPRMERRAFVLAPLAALAPELVLPSGRTVQECLEAIEALGEPALVTTEIGTR